MFRVISKKESLLFIAITFAATLGNHSVPSNLPDPGKDSVFHSFNSVRHIVHTPAYYDREFLEKLKSFKENIRIKDSCIVAGKDTVLFPRTLHAFKTYTFTAVSGERQYRLTLKRKNYTTIVFSFQSSLSGKTGYTETGEAVLDPFFFNGTNAFDDLETGEIFPAYEYIRKNSQRFLSIHCCVDPDDEGRLRAVVAFHPNPYPVKERTSPILKTTSKTLL